MNTLTKNYELENNGTTLEIKAQIQDERKIEKTLEKDLDAVVKQVEKRNNPLDALKKLNEFEEIKAEVNGDLVIPKK